MHTVETLRALPETIRLRLAAASHGSAHLAATGMRCVQLAAAEPDSRDLLDLGLDMVLAAFEADPLERRTLDFLAATQAKYPFMDPARHALVNMLRAPGCNGPLARAVSGLARARRYEEAFDAVELQASAAFDDPFLSGALVRLARRSGQWERGRALLEKQGGDEIGVRTLMLADCRFQAGDPQAALRAYEAVGWNGSTHLLGRRAACLARLGRKAEAVALHREALAIRPWLTTNLLLAHDLASGWADERRPIPGRTLLLCYTWNKAELLHATLETLAPELSRDMRLFVLDNGSTDQTPDVIAAFAERLGENMAGHIRLPVNIGAPAARNWLLSLPELAGYDFVAFIDDDALPPTGFAEYFGAAVARYPEAGAYGCKIVDVQRPERVQHADIQLVPPGRSPAAFDLPEGFATMRLLEPGRNEMDFGQYDYLRPAASVTGCFHLFRTETVVDGPSFGLRFSPSQLDDLDHDLELLENGKPAVFQGHLAVTHVRSTGLSGDAEGRLAGNAHKLYRKWTRERAQRVKRLAGQALLEDLAIRERELRDA